MHFNLFRSFFVFFSEMSEIWLRSAFCFGGLIFFDVFKSSFQINLRNERQITFAKIAWKTEFELFQNRLRTEPEFFPGKIK